MSNYQYANYGQTNRYSSPALSLSEVSVSGHSGTSTPAQDARLNKWAEYRRLARAAVESCKAIDGYHVADSVIGNFERFLRLLPDELPVSEVSLSDCGSLIFDWDEDSQNQLSIMLQSVNKIAFSAYFSGDVVHGTANFKVEDFPDEILSAAQKWSRNRNN